MPLLPFAADPKMPGDACIKDHWTAQVDSASGGQFLDGLADPVGQARTCVRLPWHRGYRGRGVTQTNVRHRILATWLFESTAIRKAFWPGVRCIQAPNMRQSHSPWMASTSPGQDAAGTPWPYLASSRETLLAVPMVRPAGVRTPAHFPALAWASVIERGMRARDTKRPHPPKPTFP
jgi:hypothetical protein